MSLKSKLISIFTAAVSVAAFSTFTLAQDAKLTTPDTATDKQVRGEGRQFGKHKFDREGFSGRHGGHGMRGGAMRILHGLNLTDAQKEQIHSIMMANKPDRANMEEAHTLVKAKHDGTITAEQQERLTALKTQAKARTMSVHQQIEAILTPEQKAQIEAKKAEMKQRMQERRDKRNQTPGTTDTPKTN